MTSQNKDAIALLIADHKEVKKLFEEFEGLGDRAKATKKKIAKEVCHELQVHTQIEEEIFYPAIAKAIKDDDLINEAIVEHAAAKDLIKQILGMSPDDELYDAKVKVLYEQIAHHIGEEEGDMFPKVRKSEIDLVALGKKMSDRREELKKGLVDRLVEALS